jgi:AcrR family transcriptional regulator
MELTKDEIVRAEILKQAQLLFQKFGLKKTTMDEIAEACGKAKSTLYYYFKSKEEVFQEVLQMELKNLRKLVKNKVDEHKTLKDKIKVYFIEFHKEAMHKINLYAVIKQELTNRLSTDYFNEIRKFEISYLTRLMEDGYDNDEFKSIEREDIPWFAELMLAAFLGIVRYSIEEKGKINESTLDKAAELIIPRIFQ